jgi:hypothetical protein
MYKKFTILWLTLTSLVKINSQAQSWSPVGSGIGSAYYHSVNSLATYNGELYVGGYFSTAGSMPANNIAKWNGTNWSAVGNGINGEVNELCVFNGELYVGGSFSTAGAIGATGVAKWNGANWSQVGNIEAYVKAMAIYNGELYAAGWFSNLNSNGSSIAKWNGNSWTAIGPENDLYTVSIECVAVYNGDLYTAGAYYAIGGGGVAEFFRITKWNGSAWNNFLTIPASYTLDGALGDILSMTVYNDELYIAGTFGMMIDTITTYQIAKWNGTNWSAVGSGINPEAYPNGGDSDGSGYSFVRSLAVYNGTLYAGGRFDSSGTIATRNIARWDGTNWSALGQGVNGHVYEMTGTDTSLFVGGWFDHVNGNLEANKIAEWNDTTNTCITAPSQPNMINGAYTVCNGTIQTYEIDLIGGATSYTWHLPQGWTGNSTSNRITVTAETNGGVISVTANNDCGSSNPQILNVVIKSVPSSPSLINGNDSICEGSFQTYYVDPVPGAAGYEWYIPYDWSGYSTTDTISIIANGYNDVLSVSAYNDCGSSNPQVLPVTISLLPQTPGYIEGNGRVCKGTTQVYFVPREQNVIDYTWELPVGWSGNSNRDSITVTAGNNNGIIYVKANNSCGSSFYQTLELLTDSIPAKPGSITGNIYTYTDTWNYYSIDKANRATGYNWSAGDGVIQTAQGGNHISAIWKKPGTYELIVKAVNNCGISEEQKLIIKVSDLNAEDPFDIKIFPNPSNGAFYLNAKRIHDKLIRIEVLTISGQTIYNSGNRPGLNDYTQFIDLKKVPQGMYIVKFIVNNKVYTRRIIKNE